MVVGKVLFMDWVRKRVGPVDTVIASRVDGAERRRAPKGFREPPLNPGKRLRPAKKRKQK